STNYFPGYYPADRTAQQPGGVPMNMPSGPSYSIPLAPMGTGQQLPIGVMEELFVENIFRFNKGKVGTFYSSAKANNLYYNRLLFLLLYTPSKLLILM
ncbi:hypothetical protein DXT76_20000, partial [Halobacillus trueperi]